MALFRVDEPVIPVEVGGRTLNVNGPLGYREWCHDLNERDNGDGCDGDHTYCRACGCTASDEEWFDSLDKELGDGPV